MNRSSAVLMDLLGKVAQCPWEIVEHSLAQPHSYPASLQTVLLHLLVLIKGDATLHSY